MDEKRLRAKLLRIFVIITAIILAAVFAVMALLSVRDERQKGRESFFVIFTAVAEKLQTEPTLKHSLLRTYEEENRMAFAITDSGVSLQYNSSDDPVRERLWEKVRNLALIEGLDTTLVPLTAQRRTSSVFRFYDNGVLYYGAVSVIPIGGAFRTLTAVQRIDGNSAWQSAFYIIAYIISVLLLGLLGFRLINKALRPAVESRTRQTQFIAAASHELRSPLAVIQASAATVAAMPEQAKAAADTIASECGRLSRLISDMLLLASTDAKNWPVHLAVVEPDTVLINVYESYSPLCKKNGFSLTLALPAQPLMDIRGDAQRLSQVLGILLDNAMHYSSAATDKALCLYAHTQKGKLIIGVIDHGGGIPDEQKPHIFERFYRGDEARGSKQHFGLGLAIAKELINLHGGTILVSDTPGGGSTFQIVL